MAPNRKVSYRQLQMIVEFAEENRHITMSDIGRGPLGQQEANKAWEHLALKLNSVAAGDTKTPEKWKRYWHLLKCRTKAKAAGSRRFINTASQSNKKIPLSDLEKRIAFITGRGVVTPKSETNNEACAETPLTAEDPLEIIHSPPQATPPIRIKHSPPQATPPIRIKYTPPQATPPIKIIHSPPQATHPIRPRPKQNREDSLPRWAYDLEERSIAAKERVADEIAAMGKTNKAILGCLQQLVGLLHEHLNSQS